LSEGFFFKKGLICLQKKFLKLWFCQTILYKRLKIKFWSPYYWYFLFENSTRVSYAGRRFYRTIWNRWRGMEYILFYKTLVFLKTGNVNPKKKVHFAHPKNIDFGMDFPPTNNNFKPKLSFFLKFSFSF
jgi:hypothetical protein